MLSDSARNLRSDIFLVTNYKFLVGLRAHREHVEWKKYSYTRNLSVVSVTSVSNVKKEFL